MLTKLLYFSSSTEPKTMKFLETVINTIKNEIKEDIDISHLNVEDSNTSEKMIEYNVQAVPCIVFLNDKGEFIRKITGEVPTNDLITYINFDIKNKKLNGN